MSVLPATPVAPVDQETQLCSLRNHVSSDEKEPDFLKGEEGRVHPEITHTSGEGLGTPWRSAQQAPPVPFGITVPCRRVGQPRPLKGDRF